MIIKSSLCNANKIKQQLNYCNMELFQKLDKIMAEGTTLTINIAKSKDSFTVSVFPGHNLVKDAAKNRIQPLNMTGKAEDFDNGFENAVFAPMQQSLGLLTKMKDFEDGVEAARKASEMEKKAKEEADKKKSDMDGWLKLAERNISDHKYKDARFCVSEAEKLTDKTKRDIPSSIAKVKARIEEADGGLFKSENEDKSDGEFTTLAALKKLGGKAEKNDSEETSDEEDND